MSRKPRVLQLWLSVIGVSGVVSIYAVGERWSTDVWAGLWMQLAFFGGVMAWVGWLFGRVYEQELSEAAQPMTEDERNRILMRLTLPAGVAFSVGWRLSFPVSSSGCSSLAQSVMAGVLAGLSSLRVYCF